MKLNRSIHLLLIPILLYALTIRGIYGNPKPADFKNNLDAPAKPLELSPERGRFIETYSLVERHSFSLDRQLADAAYPDVGYHDGRFYVFFAPGIPVMAIPFYWIGRLLNLSQLATFSMVTLFAIGDLILLYIISRKIIGLSEKSSLLAPLMFGFASASWPYAISLYQHNITTFLMLSIFYTSWRYKTVKKIIYPSVVWVCYAIAFAIDYPNAALFLPLMLYFATSARDKKTFFHWTFFVSALFGLVVFALHGYYNYTQLGKWTRLNGTIISYKILENHKLFGATDIEEQVRQMESTKSPFIFFRVNRILKGILVLLFSRDRGLFFYYPLMLFGFLGFILRLRRVPREKVVLMATILITILLYSMWNDPWGGWAYGPRYLIPSSAFLSLFLAEWISTIKKRTAVHYAIIAVFFFSAAVALLGALTTNALPTLAEGISLHSPYNYMLNIRYIFSNTSSSFFYNELLRQIIPLWMYFIGIYCAVCICFLKLQE